MIKQTYFSHLPRIELTFVGQRATGYKNNLRSKSWTWKWGDKENLSVDIPSEILRL